MFIGDSGGGRLRRYLMGPFHFLFQVQSVHGEFPSNPICGNAVLHVGRYKIYLRYPRGIEGVLNAYSQS